MLEQTLSKVLTQYKIHIQTGRQIRSHQEIDIIKKHIGDCEIYLNSGRKANGKWMEENHEVLCKAVKCSYDNYRNTYCEGEETQILNKCVCFYKKLYEQWNMDFDSVII